VGRRCCCAVVALFLAPGLLLGPVAGRVSSWMGGMTERRVVNSLPSKRWTSICAADARWSGCSLAIGSSLVKARALALRALRTTP
jgi:hypothetical protein